MANEQTWASGVNQNILRDGASWNTPANFIEDETRSGKRKRRLYATQSKRIWTITMHFTHTEYTTFDTWFKNDLKYGLYPFYFPAVDKSVNSNKVYRFTPDGEPQYTNPSGKIVRCTMKWEEQ